MKRFSIILFFLLPIYCFGQSDTQKKFSIRTGLAFNYSSIDWNLNPILLGLSKYDRKNNLHIIEIQKFSTNRKNYDYQNFSNSYNNRITEIDISLSYQYEYFLYKIESKFRPYIGSSLVFNYSYTYDEPGLSIEFPKRISEFTQQLQFDFGLNINISTNFYIDFYIPIDFLRFENIYTYSENPVITESARKTSNSDLLVLPFDKVYLKLMLGLRF